MLKEKLPPHDIDAERGVLSSILINPSALVKVADFLRPEDFYRMSHGLIYKAMLSLERKQVALDLIALKDELERQHAMETVGNFYTVVDLMDIEITSGRIGHYAKIVHEHKQLRDIISLAGEMVTNAYERNSQTLEKAIEGIHAISQGQSGNRASRLSEVMDRYMQRLSEMHEQRKRNVVTGVPTGFTAIDRILGGLQPSDLITVAARPGRGKTSLALNIAQHIMHRSAQVGCKILMFSLEMSEWQLAQRLLSMESEVDQTRLRMGDIEDEEWNPIVKAAGTLSEGQMWIDDTAGMNTTDMRMRAKREQAEHGLDLVIVDYMQLMEVTSEDSRHMENRVQQVSKISRDLKAMARELNVPVLALAQLSRAVEQRAGKVPQLSDLRESGTIEQDSDVVGFIYQDEEKKSLIDGSCYIEFMIAKHRNGPTGTATLRFVPYLTQFLNLEKYDLEVAR